MTEWLVLIGAAQSVCRTSRGAQTRRWELWGHTFLAITLLLNIVFDDSTGEYLALAFAIAALVCAVGNLTASRRRRGD